MTIKVSTKCIKLMTNIISTSFMETACELKLAEVNGYHYIVDGGQLL